MRKSIFCTIFVISILSCSAPAYYYDDHDDYYIAEINFINNTLYTMYIYSLDEDFEGFILPPKSRRVVEAWVLTSSFYEVPDWDMKIISGSLNKNSKIELVEDFHEITIFQYEFLVEYKITGTATLVDVAFKNEFGSTLKFDNVSVPHTYSFKTFRHKFVDISAINKGKTGSVTVSIYLRGQLYKTSTSNVAAQASGSTSTSGYTRSYN